MPPKWEEFTFSELIRCGALEVGDGYRAKLSELRGDGPIFLRAGHVTNTHIDFAGVDRFDRKLTETVASKMSRPGDVVVTTKGNSTGRVTFVEKNMPPFVYSPHLSFWRSRDGARIVPGFLRYWSRSNYFKEQLAGLAASTDMAPYLSLVDQGRLRIVLPSGDEQRAIAVTLGALDDKIEMNRMMNETLGEIALAIFKSWFVEFDPVRTKMQGRKVLGVGYDIAALFPDTFQDSVLGEIPFGWTSTRLSGQMEILSGGTPKTTEPEYWNGTVPWISVADTAPGPYITRTEKRITNAGVEQSAAQLLPVETIVITARGTVGNTALTAAPMAMNQSCYGLRAKGQMGQLFLLYQVRHQLANLRANTHGSVFETITRSTFDSIEAIQPPDGLLVAYEQLARPLFDRILLNQSENETLVGLRDTLLPKLMSGEIRLSQGKKIVEARA
jgi:type I restriction enzyme S subunit